MTTLYARQYILHAGIRLYGLVHGPFGRVVGGKRATGAHFDKRALSYATIFDPESGWFRPRNEKGVFSSLPEKGRLQEGYGCVESNPYQQGWFVPHDVEGMIRPDGRPWKRFWPT